LRIAVCNELFGNAELTRVFGQIRDAGFHGVELAPHTIFGDFSGDLGPGTRAVRKALADTGLEFVGLHWLLVGPPDLHATNPDDALWRRTWDHVARLTDLAGDLGGGVLVFGSPAQRASRGMMSKADARSRFLEGLARVAERAKGNRSIILLEALAAEHTDIFNTLEDVLAAVRELDHPGVGTLFDFHNVEDERLDWPGLIREYGSACSHVHLNERDGGPPSLESRDVDEFRRAFAALRAIGYDRWVSLEIFTEPDDPASALGTVRTFLASVMDEE